MNRLLRWLSIAYVLVSPTCSAQIILPAACGETYSWSADKNGDIIIKIDFSSCSVDSAEIEESFRKYLNESLSAGQRKKVKVVSLIGPESEENRHEVMAAWDYACSRAGGRSKRASSDDFLKIYRGSPVSRAIHGALSKNGMLFQVDGTDNFYPLKWRPGTPRSIRCDARLLLPVLYFARKVKPD